MRRQASSATCALPLSTRDTVAIDIPVLVGDIADGRLTRRSSPHVVVSHVVVSHLLHALFHASSVEPCVVAGLAYRQPLTIMKHAAFLAPK
jgi:uncharacterized membrane protein (DUF441 family)